MKFFDGYSRLRRDFKNEYYANIMINSKYRGAHFFLVEVEPTWMHSYRGKIGGNILLRIMIMQEIKKINHLKLS